jgi:hypothetical protein
MQGFKYDTARLLALLGCLLLVGCGSDGSSKNQPATQSDSADELTSLDLPELHLEAIETRKELTWGAIVHDFDKDGVLDFLLNGHSQTRADRVYYRRGDAFVPSDFVFPRSPDRHACAAGDVNLDGLSDVYCTEGAVKGTGEGQNQLFLGEEPQRRFRLVTEDHGARDPTARGRQVIFFHFNQDDFPDLYVTTWGDREDEALNENSVFVNQAGRFRREHSPLTGEQGHRCLSARDINRDGRDDVLLCNPRSGGSLFLSRGEEEYVRLLLPEPKLWWADITTGDINGDSRPDLLVLNGDGHLRVYYHSGDNSAPYQQLAFKRLVGRHGLGPAQATLKLAMVDLAVADINDDGALDVYIARGAALSDPEPVVDVEDLLLLGPELRQAVLIPAASEGRAYQVYGLGDRFLVLNSGERWQGDVSIVSLDKAEIKTKH